MLVKTYGSAIQGINATTITIEVNMETGINFILVGLPDNAVKESHERISAALHNNGFKIPGKKITINMAPADIRKEGSAYDLTIALGILAVWTTWLSPFILILRVVLSKGVYTLVTLILSAR